jgi:hypothetical protein
MVMRRLLFGLALGWAASAVAVPATPQVKVNFVTINTTLILEMYNVAQQHNGVVTEYPADLNPAVVTGSIDNLDANNPVTPCFQVLINEVGNVCADAGNPPLIKGPLLTLKSPVPAGAKNYPLNANSFIVSGNYNGEFCTSFQKDIENQFSGADPSKLSDLVQSLLKRRFQLCLVPDDSCSYGTPNTANGACTSLTIFTQQPGNIASVAVLIYPHNNEVPNEYPNFLWSPALYPGLGSGDISYTLELQDGRDGEILERIEIPAGQTFYQWKGTDRALTKGREYCWKVKSKVAKSGQYFGGQNGQGWNIIKCFTIRGSAPEKCNYTKEDLDKWLQKNGSPEVLAAIKGMTVQQILEVENDPAICRLLAGHVDITSIKVTKP